MRAEPSHSPAPYNHATEHESGNVAWSLYHRLYAFRYPRRASQIANIQYVRATLRRGYEHEVGSLRGTVLRLPCSQYTASTACCVDVRAVAVPSVKAASSLHAHLTKTIKTSSHRALTIHEKNKSVHYGGTRSGRSCCRASGGDVGASSHWSLLGGQTDYAIESDLHADCHLIRRCDEVYLLRSESTYYLLVDLSCQTFPLAVRSHTVGRQEECLYLWRRDSCGQARGQRNAHDIPGVDRYAVSRLRCHTRDRKSVV